MIILIGSNNSFFVFSFFPSVVYQFEFLVQDFILSLVVMHLAIAILQPYQVTTIQFVIQSSTFIYNPFFCSIMLGNFMRIFGFRTHL